MKSVLAFEEAPSPGTAAAVLHDGVRHPKLTFENLPKRGALMPAVLLACALGVLMWAVEVRDLQSSTDGLLNLPMLQPMLHTPGGQKLLSQFATAKSDSAAFGVFLAGLPSIPLGLLATAIIMHVCLAVLGAGRGGFNETARVLCYSSTGAALVVVPIVGSLASLIVVSIQLVAGLRHVHDTSNTRVVVALSLPMFIAIGVVLGGVWMFMMALGR